MIPIYDGKFKLNQAYLIEMHISALCADEIIDAQ